MAAKESNVVNLDIPQDASAHCEFTTVFLNLTQTHLSPVLDKVFTRLISYLDDKSGYAENNSKIMRLIEIKTGMQSKKNQILEQYWQNLVANFGAWQDARDSGQADIHEGELSLLENSEIEQRLAWQAAARQMELDASYQQFVNSEARLSSFMTVKTDLNPIGPMCLCESFAKSLSSLEMEPEINLDLLIQFAFHIKPAVAKLWKEADSYLDSIGLEVKNPLPCINNSEPPRVESDSRPSKNNGESLETSADEDFMDAIAQKVVSRVENLLTSQQSGTQETESGGTVKVQIAAQDLAVALTSIQKELISQHASIFTMSESIQTALEDRGMKQKLLPRHLDLINVIGMLFEFILDDHQLPNEIKKLIGLLQIPVLKQALLDKEFLVNREHPARELLNTMISAGMYLTESTANDDPVQQLIEKTVKTILKGFSDNPDIFSDSLKSFTEAMVLINENDQERDQQHLIQEQEFIIQENSESDVDTALNSCITAYDIPQALDDFVKQAWRKVLEHMVWQGKDDEEQWHDALNTLNMLLWNLQPDNLPAVEADNWQFLKKSLQDRLNEVQYDPFQVANWMYALDRLIVDPMGEEIQEEEEIVIEEQAAPSNEYCDSYVLPTDDPEQEHLDENHDRIEDSAPGGGEDDSHAHEYPIFDPSSRVHTSKLHAGQWVEFIGKNDHHLRCKLSAIIRESDRYIFVNRSGMKVVEWSGTELERGISKGNIKVLENIQFFDRALHAVMENFLKF